MSACTRRVPFHTLLAVSVCAGCVGGEVGSEAQSDRARADLAAIPQYSHRRVCDKPAASGFARCHAQVRVGAAGQSLATAAPSGGYFPADLASAYNLPASGGAGLTVAIVDAHDDPNAESDLAVYRSQFGLPPCTTANGCFMKVNQFGASSPLPSPDNGWAAEISLDLDMVSAACPQCKILLVEASSTSINDLGTAVNTAAAMGTVAISNSYGGPEFSSENTYDAQYYNHPGILVTVSSGDNGYGVEFPAASPHVLAVGGTSLVKSSSNPRGWTEGAWSGAGSGCSKYASKPAYQTDPGCSKRTVADVSAVADPNTGVAVYDSYGTGGGWNVFGGTSVSAPLLAAIYAVTGRASAGPGFGYSVPGDFYDVLTGSNGSCTTTYLCTALAGYDGPTGLGTPNGLALAGGGGGGTDGGTDGGSDGGSTCAHPICSTGGPLTASCDACAAKICSVDSYCCNVAWDGICVGEVQSVCAQSCTGGGSDAGSDAGSGDAGTDGGTGGGDAGIDGGTGGGDAGTDGGTGGGDAGTDGGTGGGDAGTDGGTGGGDAGTDGGTGGGDAGIDGGTDGGSDGGTGGACAHPICTAGGPLTASCDACAGKVCGVDPYCCATAWDSVCVGEVQSICGQSCGGGGGDGGTDGGSSCAHPVCSTGSALTASCSSCAAAVCSHDSYCCTTAWDSICVSEVPTYCGMSCP